MNKKNASIAAGVAGLAALVLAGCAGMGAMNGPSDADAAKLAQQTMKASFVTSGIASIDRLTQDELQQLCTEYAGKEVPKEIGEKIEKAQQAAIVMPASGNLIGNWQEGEKIAQNGRGMTFTDKAGDPGGGNCYACHQIAPQEISYGNIGPSLYNYGKLRGQSPEVVAYTYKKIYNSQAFAACSNMPRFGHQKILSETQIKDLVGLLLDPQSPVNK
ncbi:sulfur oxidation c-type cytochrome SoxX [Undibacterium terreum]|uniref:Sulfur oxidation c-type cytochrome SoxX n=2 Tax=Undibacterium terreum TaxID=1224302 RepID=A0A916XNR4_9BURK|nr:sulfur oxidation c-type cytochrome SoxX [Undibacterium terreum]